MSTLTVCPKCNHYIGISDWPFCPHGQAGRFASIRDEIPGGLVVENYGPEPLRFDSYSALRDYRVANGLQLKEKFCPMPGTDIDPAGIPNPAGYVDPYTLASGAELIKRNGRKEWDAVESGVLVNLTTEVVDDAEKVRMYAGGESVDAQRGSAVGAEERGADQPERTGDAEPLARVGGETRDQRRLSEV